MSVVNKLIRVLAYEALVSRLAELGKTIDDLMPDDVEEILDLVVKDSERYTIDYKAYMHRLVGVIGDAIALNI